jgi:hypothetical protein
MTVEVAVDAVIPWVLWRARGMKAYSIDLCERVVAACDARDGTREQIAARFFVSVAWIRKLIR